MQVRRLGGSGLEVSRLGLGTMSWGAAVDEYVAEEQLALYLEMGGSLIDTAPIYGDGRCEELLGRLLAKSGARESLVLAGKAGLVHRGSQVVRDTSRRSLLNQLDQSLRELGTDHLDLWQVHRWDEVTPIEEVMSALDLAINAGKVRYAGISNFTGWQTALAHIAFGSHGGGVPLVSTQVEYSLMHRDPEEEVIAAASHLGMSVLCWSPLGRGVLTGKYRRGVPIDSRAADERWEPFVAPYLAPEKSHIVDAVAAAADGLGFSMAHVALAWVRDRPTVASAIIGARTAEQLAESLASEELELPQEIQTALSDVSQGV